MEEVKLSEIGSVASWLRSAEFGSEEPGEKLTETPKTPVNAVVLMPRPESIVSCGGNNT